MSQPLSVADLLAAPAHFEGQSVTVVGFYVGEREHHALYPSPADVGTSSRGVWLSHEATCGGRDAVARLSRGWVRLTGVFHNRVRSGAGHFSAFPAYVSGISVFESAEPAGGGAG
jgi:hypothetical protein